MDTALSVDKIQRLIVDYEGGARTSIFVPNVSWGYFKSHEADLLRISKQGYLTEYEIKRSWSDFLADFKKRTLHFENKVSQMFYVVPKNIGERCWEYIVNHEWPSPYNKTKVGEVIPPVGLITYNENAIMKIVHNAPMLYRYSNESKDYKLTDAEMYKIARLGCFRIWDKRAKDIKKALRENPEIYFTYTN